MTRTLPSAGKKRSPTRLEGRIEGRIFEAALGGDIKAGQWLLARRLPGLYGRRVELEQQGEVRAKRDVRIRLVTATKGRKDLDD